MNHRVELLKGGPHARTQRDYAFMAELSEHQSENKVARLTINDGEHCADVTGVTPNELVEVSIKLLAAAVRLGYDPNRWSNVTREVGRMVSDQEQRDSVVVMQLLNQIRESDPKAMQELVSWSTPYRPDGRRFEITQQLLGDPDIESLSALRLLNVILERLGIQPVRIMWEHERPQLLGFAHRDNVQNELNKHKDKNVFSSLG